MMSKLLACRLSAVFGFAWALFLPPAFAQNPTDLFTKAPPDVDEALRSRISKFYQAQVDGKARQAEQYVAEESKDYYYEMGKPKYLSHEIRQIYYSDNFTKAKAVVVVEMHIMIPGFPNTPMPVPLPTTWKLVNGQWYWYIDPDTGSTTPFGKMKFGSSTEGTADHGLPPDLSKGPDTESLWKRVSVDKQTVRLKSAEASSDQVTISNQLPGVVSLRLQPPEVPGLRIKLDRQELKTGEKASLSFRFEPDGDLPHKPVTVNLTVEPVNFVIPIQVLFQ
jgi:hypothetical protein